MTSQSSDSTSYIHVPGLRREDRGWQGTGLTVEVDARWMRVAAGHRSNPQPATVTAF